jgi:hypothetical protein
MPASKVIGVITGLDMTVICRFAVSVAPASSCTLTVNWEFPGWSGVPLMMPPLLNANPRGRAPPDTDHVYGVFPPVAERACE